MSILSTIAFNNVEPIDKLSDIIRIRILVREKELLKLRIRFTLKMRRIKTDLIAVFQ